MLEKLTYINHINEILEFGIDGLYANENDIRDYQWDIISKNDKISGFSKGIVSKAIPVLIKRETGEDGLATRNRVFEIFEKDVLNEKHGKLYVGEYYLKCFVTGSQKSNYLMQNDHIVLTLTVRSDFPEWVRESRHMYAVGDTAESEFLDFNRDFPYDYKSIPQIGSINNAGFAPSNFRIIIFGHVENPVIYIGDHAYEVDTTVGAGEYLTIDSVNKTILLTKNDGTLINCFNKRNRDSYIFQKIPAGMNSLTTLDKEFSFEITLLEERSEPKWT